jgi:trigger factor
MKKYFALLLAASLLMSVLSGCANKGMSDTAEYMKDIQADKYVTLGQYKGLELIIAAPAVTADDIDDYINNLMLEYPMLLPSNGPAAVGDEINIDFVGKIDDIAFDNGSAEGYAYTLGSYEVISDLDEGMVGMRVGEVRDVPVTFPDDYRSADLAGQPAVFTVTLNSIMAPVRDQELNDEYITWLTAESADAFTNVADFRVYIEEFLWREAEAAYEADISNQIAGLVVTNAEIASVPAGILNRNISFMTDYLNYYASLYGIDLSTFLYYFGYMNYDGDPEAVIAGMADASVRQYLVFQAIADVEGLAVTDEEFDIEVAREAEGSGMTVDEYLASIDVDGYREFLMLSKVAAFLLEHTIITE